MASTLGLLTTLIVREPLRALARHKLRSGLSALSISVGVAAVVLVVAVGQAGSDRAQEELQKLGDNLVWIEAGARNLAGVRTGTHGSVSLSLDDYEALRKAVPLLRTCSPQVDGGFLIIGGNRNWTTRYRGVTPDYLRIKKWTVAEGVAISDEDLLQSASKVLLGKTVRERLFGEREAIGEVVRIQGQLYEVAGVLGAKGQTPEGRDQDDWVLLPHTTAQTKLRGSGIHYLDDILCSAVAPESVNAAIDMIIPFMRERHHIRADQDDDFNIRRPDEVLKAQIEAADTLSTFLLCIAAVSLLVGGIGIMNVMLASVVQRTREIGLRVALGATPTLVMVQFLAESVVLCGSGALAGIILSATGSSAFGRLLGWSIALSPSAVLIALGSSVAVGVLSGFYPALHAARLDPIVALRHE